MKTTNSKWVHCILFILFANLVSMIIYIYERFEHILVKLMGRFTVVFDRAEVYDRVILYHLIYLFFVL